MSEWPWRYRSRTKIIMCNTPCHASNNLCLIRKESTQNCRHYRVPCPGQTDGRPDRQMDGWMEWNQYTTPQWIHCAGGIKSPSITSIARKYILGTFGKCRENIKKHNNTANWSSTQDFYPTFSIAWAQSYDRRTTLWKLEMGITRDTPSQVAW